MFLLSVNQIFQTGTTKELLDINFWGWILEEEVKNDMNDHN